MWSIGYGQLNICQHNKWVCIGDLNVAAAHLYNFSNMLLTNGFEVAATFVKSNEKFLLFCLK